MITRLSFLFVGLILAGVFCVLYLLPISFITVFLFRIRDEWFLRIQYSVCLSCGIISAYSLMQKVTIRPKQKELKQARSEGSQTDNVSSN